MGRNGGDGLFNGPVHSAVGGLGSVRVHAVDGHLDFLNHVDAVVVQSHFEQGVQRDFFVRQIFHGFVSQKVQNAANHSLVRDHEQIVGGQHGGHNLHKTTKIH